MMSQGRTAVAAAVAEDVEVRVEPCFRDGGAPLPAVPLGGFNRRRDAAVAEREQRLVVRVPLRLDVEVHVVETGEQLAQPFALRVRDGGIFHRSHWYAVPGLGMSGLTLPTMRPSWPRARPYFSITSRMRTVRSRIARRSSSVSVGNPIM
jgi:hypothetical protein